MRKLALSVLLGAGALAATWAPAATTAFNTRSSGVISVAVFGDAPYGTTPTDDAEFKAFPAFIAAVNSDPDVSLVLHVGDIHSGKQFCTEAYDRAVFYLYATFQAPLVYTPGDNEWADCHKKAQGGGEYNPATGNTDYVLDAAGNPVDHERGDPLANLDLVRAIFFANPGRAIGARKLLLSQAQAFDAAHPADAKYVENVMWEQSRTLFVTLNIPGGSNNDADIWFKAPTLSARQADEIAQRTGADLRWLDAAFERAKADGVNALVIQTQADMWDLDGKAPSHIRNYQAFIARIAERTADFGKPVLLLNGDSHVYRSDNPLVQGAPCVTEAGAGEAACKDDAFANQASNSAVAYNVPNFHRITVHGSTTPLEWLKLTIDPRAHAAGSANAFGPFSWQRMIPQ